MSLLPYLSLGALFVAVIGLPTEVRADRRLFHQRRQ